MTYPLLTTLAPETDSGSVTRASLRRPIFNP